MKSAAGAMASIYLDYNGSTPIDAAVAAVMRPLLETKACSLREAIARRTLSHPRSSIPRSLRRADSSSGWSPG